MTIQRILSFLFLVASLCLSLSPLNRLSRRTFVATGAATAALSRVTPSVAEPNPFLEDLLSQLREIPTFCIVNKETGASYFLLVKPDFAKGYAFFTLSGALAVLRDAQATAEKQGNTDLWDPAAITIVPADIAMRLTLKSAGRYSQRDPDNQVRTLLEVIPGAQERNDGYVKDKRMFKEQGRVPLFYSTSFKTADDRVLLFFNQQDFLAQWQERFGAEQLPPNLSVMELTRFFQDVVERQTSEFPFDKVKLVRSSVSVEAAENFKKEVPKMPPYRVNQMIV